MIQKDFGVCYWRSNIGSAVIPKAYQRRDIYEMDNDEQSIEFSFDTRYFDCVILLNYMN